MIESDSGYLLLAPAQADTLLEFGFDIIEALMESLNIHPEIHDKPHDSVFSFDMNPEHIQWVTANVVDLVLQKRLSEAAAQLIKMSPAQGSKLLAKMNTVPNDVMQQRLTHYADLWLEYSGSTNILMQTWNVVVN